MATDLAYIDFIRDLLGRGHRAEFRKMFGEYAMYLDGKVVALVCDNQVFLKPTDTGRALLGRVEEAPPYPGAKPYFSVSDRMEERELFLELLEVTAAAMPRPKPKAAKGTKAAAKSSAAARKVPAKKK